MQQALAAQFQLDKKFGQAGKNNAPQEYKTDLGPHVRGHQQLAGTHHRPRDDDAGANIAQQAAQALGGRAGLALFSLLHFFLPSSLIRAAI